MSIHQNIDFCFEDKIGKTGISMAEFKLARNKLVSLVQNIKNEKPPVFDLSERNERVEQASKIAKRISRKADTIYILGTGGATLCGQTVNGLVEGNFKQKKKVIFLDNIDPYTLGNTCKSMDINRSHFLVISKSGGTLETLTQFLFFLSFVAKKTKGYHERFSVITHLENNPNKIREIAEDNKIEIIEHEKVGGRFSIFTNVSLITAAFVGLDITKFLNSANRFFENSYNNKEQSAIEGAALNILFSKKCSANVIFPYEDRLKNFNSWYSQIYAESLGKDPQAMSPIRALGTLDQHSQLQQFLEGRKDKFFTLITSERDNFGDEVVSAKFKKYAPEYLQGKKIGDVIQSSFFSTCETFRKNNIPNRIITLPKIDEETLGELCAFSIMEVVLTGYYYGINVFDQPAVEQGKKIAINILSNGKNKRVA